MKALLCLGTAVPAGICASKANTGTGFGLLGRCWSLSFPRSTGPFIRAPLCGCSRDPPTPLPEDSDNRQDERERDVDIAQEVTHSWMESWEMLLDHIFGPPGKLGSREPVNKLKLLQGDMESKPLIESAEKSWREYKKLKEGGFGLQAPTAE